MNENDSYQLTVDNRELVERKHYSTLFTRTSEVQLRMSEFQVMKYVRALGMDMSKIDIHPSSAGNVNKFGKLIFKIS